MTLGNTRPATLVQVEHAMLMQELQNPKIRAKFVAYMGDVRRDIADFVTNLPTADLGDEATVNRIRRYNAQLRGRAADRTDTNAQCRVFDLERSDLPQLFTTRSVAWERIAGKNFHLKSAVINIAKGRIRTSSIDDKLNAELKKLVAGVEKARASPALQVPPPMLHQLADQAGTGNWTFASGGEKVIADFMDDRAGIRPFEARRAFAVLRR